MSPSNNKYPNKEIDLREIISFLWKQKILIIIISTFFSAAAYLYNIQQPKVYEAEIQIKYADKILLKPYFDRGIISQMSEGQLYNSNFYKLITSNKNFREFLNNNNHYKSLVLKYYNNIENYFNKNFRATLNKQKLDKGGLPDVFRLKFTKSLDGSNLLSEYIVFSKKKADQFYSGRLVFLYKNKIDLYEERLQVSKTLAIENEGNISKINQHKDVIEMTKSSTIVSRTFNYDLLYLKGEKVLKEEINLLKKNLKNVRDLTLDFYPIVNSPLPIPKMISIKPQFYALVGLVLGFFFSIAVIFLRSFRKK